MYTILYENKYNKQYCSDYCFNELSEAKDHLESKGYTENNRIFYLTSDWGNSKAYIHYLKLHDNTIK